MTTTTTDTIAFRVAFCEGCEADVDTVLEHADTADEREVCGECASDGIWESEREWVAAMEHDAAEAAWEAAREDYYGL